MPGGVVIVGAGQAGLTAAMALRERGWEDGIHLVGDEIHLPYQRPSLSKGYLSGKEHRQDLLLRTAEALERDRIELHQQTEAVGIDRVARLVALRDGGSLSYDYLILATGSEPRSLQIPGGDLGGIYAVRTIEDADALRADIARGGETVMIGGGFLNLEVAVEAAKFGPVTVLEIAPQILGRVLSRETADELERYHSELGIEIRCGAQITAIRSLDDRVSGVEVGSGEIVPANRVVLSVGAVARDAVAVAAELESAGGILVDEHLRTCDERIFAIGDCAKFYSPFAGTEMRVESVQNAVDQGKQVAETIVSGVGEGYWAVPWFWSTQGDRRLQIAGIAMPGDEARVVERGEKGRPVVERVRGETVVAVESINATAAHMRARRSLAGLAL